jgi:Skp family chaperone for outer membrane proteins
MKKIFLFTVLLLSVSLSWAQRGQIIAYIDMEYILENVPEYLEAQNTLDGKIVKWQQKLDKQARFIEVLKTDLANEKAILTKDLIEEKEEEANSRSSVQRHPEYFC